MNRPTSIVEATLVPLSRYSGRGRGEGSLTDASRSSSKTTPHPDPLSDYWERGKCIALLIALILFAPLRALAAPSATDEAAYTQAINKRADDIVALLDISDATKSAKVHEILVAQYRSLRDWHGANDPKLKAADKDQAAAIRETLKPIHDQFLAKLSEELTPEQIEKVKDKMTYGKVKVTYDAYVEIAQTLTTEQKAKILEWLKDAREEAIDGGSAEEKSAIFKKYKGKINNYLSSQGIDMKQKTKEWGDRQKAKNGRPPATQPENT